jgi:DNA-binding cell septation regulator SpoVG
MIENKESSKRSPLRITDVKFAIAPDDGVDDGLLGFISCTVNGRLRLDGIALRQTADGRFVVSFPSRTDRLGRQHHYLRPLDDETREQIEQQILACLARENAS